MVLVSRAIDHQVRVKPYGDPVSYKYINSLRDRKRKARYFIGCGEYSIPFTDVIQRYIDQLRFQPSNDFPITFLKCKGLGSMDPWKNLSKDNPLPFTAYFDDFEDERHQLNLMHGDAFPVTQGFYLGSILSRASNQ
jgi:hypothetical protein